MQHPTGPGLFIDTTHGSGSLAPHARAPGKYQPTPQFTPSPLIRTNTVELEKAIDLRDRQEASLIQGIQNVLNHLHARPAVTVSALDQFKVGAVEVSQRRGFNPISLLPASGFAGFRKDTAQPEPDGETDEVDSSTQKAYAVCDQVLGLVVILNSARHGWDGLNQSYASSTVDEPPKSPVTKSPMSASPFRRRSSLEERSRRLDTNNVKGTLFAQCLSVLSSLVVDDCRVTSLPPSVKRPPYTLQAYTLDLASTLARLQTNYPEALIDIGLALLPAFTTFPPVMLHRLLVVFEQDLLRPTLERLRALRLSPALEDHIRDAVPADGSGLISISVNEPGDARSAQAPPPGGARIPWTTPAQTAKESLVSSTAPQQHRLIYRLGSLIQPLIGTLFTVQSLRQAFTTIYNAQRQPLPDVAHQVCRVLDLIVQCKPDAYTDILEVLAFPNAPLTRAYAAGVLAAYWPKALGHVFLGWPLPELDFGAVWLRHDYHRAHQLSHEFMIWRFSQDSSDAPHGDCDVCHQKIPGTGLLCPFCMCCVHTSCYRDRNGISWTPLNSAAGVNAPIMASREAPLVLYSHVRPARIGKNMFTACGGHHFGLANLFTLTLCGACQEPLWGTRMQACICHGCRLPVHHRCMMSKRLPNCNPGHPHYSGSWSMIRSTFLDHYRPMLFSERDLDGKSYEELSVVYSILHTQLQILGLGFQHFTICVETQAPGAEPEVVRDFELHYVVRLYQAHLSSLRYNMAHQIRTYIHPRAFIPDHMILYNFSLLAFLTSLIKTALDDSVTGTTPASQGMLSASTYGEDEDESESSSVYEIVSFAHLRDVLGYELNISSDRAAVELLQHISCVGFFTRADAEPVLDAPLDELKKLKCTFPLPIALDLHNDHVETLVSAIEACLDGINVTNNEIGFLLLARRCWPSSQHTDYALSRLARVVLRWIVSEEDRLVVVSRDYQKEGFAGFQSAGIPGTTSNYPWPRNLEVESERKYSAGNQYQLHRRTLRDRYASRWLRALHDQDANFYAHALFEHVTDLAAEYGSAKANPESSTGGADVKDTIERADRVLRIIIKLRDSEVLFSSFEDVMLKWLLAITPLCLVHKGAIVFKNLKSICHRESDSSGGPENGATAKAKVVSMDLWRVVDEFAEKGGDDLLEGLQWLRVMAQSGVDIPTLTFKRLAGVIRDTGSPIAQAMTLVEAMVASVWLKPGDKQDLQFLLEQMHSRYVKSICASFGRSEEDSQAMLSFIRQSLAVALLLRGCERQAILNRGLLEKAETTGLGNVQRLAVVIARPEYREPPDPEFLDALKKYLKDGPDSVALHVASYLNFLLGDGAVMTAPEREQLVIGDGYCLSQCAWQLYDIQLHALSEMRMQILLHLLTVSWQPFELILTKIFTSDAWETRFQALTRLFRIIMDITHPKFLVDGHKWQASIAPVFQFFFEALWQDNMETIRLAVDTWLKTLLPAHFDGIAACWNDYFLTADHKEQLRLVSFLTQLQTHFPQWQTLRWETINGVTQATQRDSQRIAKEQQHSPLTESQAASTLHMPRYGYTATTAFEVDGLNVRLQLRCALVSLGLYMVANGVPIQARHLVELKLIVATELGFAGSALHQIQGATERHLRLGRLIEFPSYAHPCLTPLLKVLDAVVYIKFPLSALGIEAEGDSAQRELVGQFFVDLILRLVNSSVDDREKVEADRMKKDASAAEWRPDPRSRPYADSTARDVQPTASSDSAFSLSSLPYTVLRSLIETVIVIIQKHEVDTKKGLIPLRSELRNAVRNISLLLQQNVDYDTRNLAIIAGLVLVKRHRELSRSIVGHLTSLTLDMLVDLKPNNDDMLVIQGRNFVKVAFQRFPDGIFWHLAKKPLAPKYFDALRTIIDEPAQVQVAVDDDAVVVATLKDAIIRSTLRHGLRNLDDPALATILQNLNGFVEQIYHDNYDVDLLLALGLALTGYQKTEWPPGFDASGLIEMISCVILHNRQASRDTLISQFEAFIRKMLAVYTINSRAMEKLIRVAHSQRGAGTTVIPMSILDVLSDAAQGKYRMDVATLGSISEALATQLLTRHERPLFESQTIISAANDAMLCVCTLPVPPNFQLPVLQSYMKVMRLVLSAASQDSNFLSFVLSNPRMRLRSWNLLVLHALEQQNSGIAARLFGHLQLFAMCLENELNSALSAYTSDVGSLTSATLSGDIGHAAVAIQLWLLLARMRIAPGQEGESQHHLPASDSALEGIEAMYDSQQLAQSWPHQQSQPSAYRQEAQTLADAETNVGEWRVWTELYAPFERFAKALVPVGLPVPRSSLGESTWRTLLDVIAFAHSAGCALTSETGSFQALVQHSESVPFDAMINPKLRNEVIAFRDAPDLKELSVLLGTARDQLFVADTAYHVANRMANASAGPRRRMPAVAT